MWTLAERPSAVPLNTPPRILRLRVYHAAEGACVSSENLVPQNSGNAGPADPNSYRGFLSSRTREECMYGDAKRRDVLLLLLAADPAASAVAPPPTGPPKRSASVNGFSRIDSCSHRHPPIAPQPRGFGTSSQEQPPSAASRDHECRSGPRLTENSRLERIRSSGQSIAVARCAATLLRSAGGSA